MAQIEVLNANEAMRHIDGLVALLHDAVDHGVSVGFLPPLSESESLSFWQQTIRELNTGKRILIVALEGVNVVGSAQLDLADMPSATHRATIQKLFVHTGHRNKGIGKDLMDRLELEAKNAGRTLLVFDTKAGDSADLVYAKRGYQKAGVVPQYARQADGSLADTVIYYRFIG